jgi:hypothetical protein
MYIRSAWGEEDGEKKIGLPKKQSLFQSNLVLILSYLVDRLTTLQVVNIITLILYISPINRRRGN